LQNINVNYIWYKMQFGALGINLAEMTGLIAARPIRILNINNNDSNKAITDCSVHARRQYV